MSLELPPTLLYFDEEFGHEFWDMERRFRSGEKNLLFAVLMQALKDCSGSKTVKGDYEQPRAAQIDGQGWFRERSYRMVGWGLVIEELEFSPRTVRKLEYCGLNGLDPFPAPFSFYRSNVPLRRVGGDSNNAEHWRRLAAMG